MRTKIIALAAMLIASTAHAQVPPDKAIPTFKVSEGLEITLWASEPLCVNPTSMDVDHKGRVWLCESINYRCKLRNQPLRRAEGDRIVVLEDTDNDGKADKSHTFYQAPDILAPLSVCVAPYPDGKGQKVYVAHSPHIYLFDDKDGDLKADGPPKVFLTGFKGYDHDHGVHGLLIGPDNRLYFSVGDQGVQNLQSADGKGRKWTSNSTDCRAGTIWRCDLDGKNLELIAHNFRNNYEPCVDSFGNIFVSDNDDDGSDQSRICFVMPGGNYGYHPRGKGQSHWHEEQPGIVPKILRTFRGSPTGMCFYEGELLPKKYWGQPLHTDAGPGRLSCYHLKPKGAGYDVEREDMVTSTDSWFRPSDVCVAPDGSIFVADWYDPGVGGHGIGDFTRGRVYRVAAKNAKPTQPNPGLKTVQDLVTAYGSPNLATLAYAATKHIEMSRSPRSSERLPSHTAKELKDDAVRRARLFWNTSGPIATHDVLKALQDSRPEFASLALRELSTDWAGTRWEWFNIWNSRSDYQDTVLKHPSAAVRREALLALRTDNPQSARDSIYELAKQYDGKDRFYLAALGIAVGQPGISPEIDKRREIILADFAKHFPEWNEKVAGLVWELRPPGMVAMLAKNLSDPKVPANQRALIVDILAGVPEKEVAELFLKTLAREDVPAEVRDAIVIELKEKLRSDWSHVAKSDFLVDAIQKLVRKNETQVAGMSLIAAGQQRQFLHDLQLIALQSQQLEGRLAAVRTLGEFKDAATTKRLGLIIQQKQTAMPDEVRGEAILSLGKQNTAASNEILKDLVVQKELPAVLRQSAAAGLAGSKDGSSWLLSNYRDKKLADDLTADLSRLLRNSPFVEIRKESNRAFPPPPKLDPKKLPSIPALLAQKGSSERGRNVMLASLKNDVQCMKCHTIGGQGGQVGPDLTTIGSKASRENLLESILYPSRAISHGFAQWTVETKKGVLINGLLIEDMPTHIVLRDANAKDHRIDTKDIESRKESPISLMPDNLLLYLPEQELVDLVEYLFSLKSSPIVGAGERN